ncbi:iron chelate uptake ABC transporter family permease subunit [Salinispira pacifica]|uniref:iron chelate uptake ABC transporter family permease subunit n=1 Tax=Salinispira pacifica TaxID=1307761 RepID=UPI00041AE31A|nr:iron chelate uptake ABC transporter family permease subunit [Salinispira pacifica]
MKKTSFLFAFLGAAIPFAALISVTVGTADITVPETLRVLGASMGAGSFEGIADSSRIIILNLRLPRILLALSSGACLAAAGAVLQGVFLNPMADPYVMGISSGAAFAVAIGIILGTSNQITLQIFALIGSAGAVALVLAVAGLASRRGESTGLLLAGIAISVMLSSGYP